MKPIFRNIYNNDYLFSICSKISGVAFGVVYMIILNRYLGSSLKGEFAVMSNYINIFSIILCFGINESYPVFSRKHNHDIPTYIGNLKSLLLIYLVISGLILLCPLKTEAKLVVAALPFSVIDSPLQYVLQVERPRKKNTQYIIINISTLLLLTGIMLFMKANSFCVIVIIFSKIILTLVLTIINIGKVFFSCRLRIKELMQYIIYGFIPMLVTLLMTINYRIDIIMLEGHVNIGDIGIYSLAVNLTDKIWLIPDALKEILVSKLAKGKHFSEVARVIRISIALCMVMIFFLIVLGKHIIEFFFGAEFSLAYNITLVLLFGVISMIFYKMVYAYNVVEGYRCINFIFLSLAAISNVGANLFLIPHYGIMGAAAASVVSYLLCGFLFLIYFKRKTGLSYYTILVINKNDLQDIRKKFM